MKVQSPVATRSEMTKGGLLYHFPTKDAMLLALHERLAQTWSDELGAALGSAPEDASSIERVRAYAKVSARSATGPELRLMLEATASPELDRPWKDVIARWLPDPSTLNPADPDVLDVLIARFAADGLWMADSLNAAPLSPQLRTAIADRIADTLRVGAGS